MPVWISSIRLTQDIDTMDQAELLTTRKSENGQHQNGEMKKKDILNDYRLAVISRETSILGRKDVLSGRGKFGIFGDGKELPQIVMAKHFRDGDFRAGYYRDQTFMMAIGQLTVQQFFAQLYGHADLEHEPSGGGRQMSSHFSTRSLNNDGTWKDLAKMKNSSPDISPTAGQMARMLGLAQASKFYRQTEPQEKFNKFSNNGNEVVFGTIGDSSTSEGVFWEAVNAAGVMEVPMILSVLDDGYGISVSTEYQTVKGSISKALQGFRRSKRQNGIEILRVKAWDYEELLKVYAEAEKLAREDHIPVLVHVEDVTQPLGHSTSGSHERYKSKERLQFEEDFNCNRKMRELILEKGFATEKELNQIDEEAEQYVLDQKNKAWKADREPIKKEIHDVTTLIDRMMAQVGSESSDQLAAIKKEMKQPMYPIRRDIVRGAKKALRAVRGVDLQPKRDLQVWLENEQQANRDRYDTHVISETEFSPLKVKEVAPEYGEQPEEVDARLIIRDNFDALFSKYPETLLFGEDVGQLGDVNKGAEGLQEKYGELRVFDTGIREDTILGQGIGMALRGLRPIAEIQYLDYLLYCYQTLSDDLATVRYRTKGGQKAPVIVRTRGHRLEGIWHSGSPMGMVIHGIRGVHVCVPRNFKDAAGMYNTLLQGDDPALIVEPLNAYRLKEKKPQNLGEFTVPLGMPEVVREGSDLTIVSYGSTCNLAEKAVDELNDIGISAELIDARTLLPFDLNGRIVDSLKKTNRVLFADEDMPGGATSYMMQQVLEEQKGYFYLDSEPRTVTAKNHRPAYGSDGDYFSKPNVEDIVDAAYAIMNEAKPADFPEVYR